MSSFDYDAFVKDKAYADTYTKSVQKSVLDFANHTNGAVTAYLRYNPKYSNPTSGVFAQRPSLDQDLECLTPTDFSMYDEGDVEHVGWYYLPVQAGKAIWMSPYMNENVNIYMISYVVPLQRIIQQLPRSLQRVCRRPEPTRQVLWKVLGSWNKAPEIFTVWRQMEQKTPARFRKEPEK